MFSRLFIDRPIFAAVLSVFIVIAGLAAMRNLPIAQYPEIAPPVVTVTANYPGASATVIEQTVAAPIENAINGIEHMIYMSSTSTSNGTVQIHVTFDVGTDIDQAAVNINNRVRQVEPRLPTEVRRLGVTVEKSSSSFLLVAAFYSPESRYDSLYISNFVTMNVLDVVKRVPGTTNVQIFGAKDYAMRIWVKPDRLTQLKLTTADLIAVLNEQNAQFAAGKIGQAPASGPQELVYTVTTKGRLADPGEFENIIVRANPDGSTLRLKDVARVELGSKDYEFIGRVNGKEAVLVGVFLQPGANALEVSKSVKNVVRTLSARFPDGLVYSVPYDTTRFVEVSIREVLKTLGEAMLLVFLVVFLFLQNWRATLIPFAAVPVSLIGTFAGLYLLGYSINTLTLFGMVLAIGIVVDDAIVVLENVERIMHEEHLDAREAAVKAMTEVTSPIIAIVLVLCAVFVPIAFLGGLTGALLHLVQRMVSPRDRTLHRWRRVDDPPRRDRGGAVRGDGCARRRVMAHHAGEPGAGRRPGLLHRRSDSARWRIARAHRPCGDRSGRGDPVQPSQRKRDRIHRLRFHRRRPSPQRGDGLRHAKALGRAHRHRLAAAWRAIH